MWRGFPKQGVSSSSHFGKSVGSRVAATSSHTEGDFLCYVATCEQKGRCTFASKAFLAGDPVFQETVIIAVQPRKRQLARTLEERCGVAWTAWYAAVESLAHPSSTQNQIKQLQLRSTVGTAEEALAKDLCSTLAELEGADWKNLLDFFQAWAAHSFRSGAGLALYKHASLLAHSCDPS